MKETKLNATLQKSYYGKAKVIEYDNGRKDLKSYDTIVCAIDENGAFIRLWGGYSRTTMNHVNDFRRENGFPMLNKKAWESIPCENTERFQVIGRNYYTGREYKCGPVFDSENDAWSFAETMAGHAWNACLDVVAC